MKYLIVTSLIIFSTSAMAVETVEEINAKIHAAEMIPEDSVYSPETKNLILNTQQKKVQMRRELIHQQKEAESKVPTYTESDMARECATPIVIEKARMTEAVFDKYKANKKRCFLIKWSEFIHSEGK